MKYGKLDFSPAEDNLKLVGKPTQTSITELGLSGILVAEIDPAASDTAAFCERYDIGLDVSANCVVVQAKRGERVWYAAVVVLATTRADINGVVRKELGAKKLSFSPMDLAVEHSGMEFGGINPIGLPTDWPILVDNKVAALGKAIIGSGVRQSKLLVSGALLASLPGAKVLDLIKI